MLSIQNIIHYFLHFGFPLLVAYVFFRKNWKKIYLIWLGAMLVDLDHLLSQPVFQANRCSVGFHFLHSYYAIAGYVVLLFFPKPYKFIAMGLLFHMLTDLIDCAFIYDVCKECFENTTISNLLTNLLA